MSAQPLQLGNVPLVVSSIFPSTLGTAISAASPIISQIRLDWYLVDTIWGGTTTMRLARELYLPKEPLEAPSDYDRRLRRTTLHNYYKRTIQSGVAKIFTKDTYLEVGQDDDSDDTTANVAEVSQLLTSFVADVDTQDRNISQFAKVVLEDAVNHGVSYILVDYASVPQDYANLAEEQAAGNRPYWVSIPANTVLDARSEKFADGERLSFFKFIEQVTELSDDLVTTSVYNQVRIYKQDPARPVVVDQETGEIILPSTQDSPVYFAVYRQSNNGINSSGSSLSGQWNLLRWGTISVDAIPVLPAYTNKVGFFVGTPPLKDLAELNIEHWQKKSDINNVLHVATVPILFGKGFKPELDDQVGGDKKLEIAPNSIVTTSSQDADLRWVEHTGAAVNSARLDIKDLEARMESLGMVLTTIQNGGVSATANSINAAEANSLLKVYALSLQDTLNSALDFTCQYLNIPNTARVVVNTDYAIDYTTNATMGDVLSAFNAGVIDKSTVIAEAKRRNVFDQAANIVPPTTNESLTPAVAVANSQDITTSDTDNDSN
jgi:hypothetical protein